MNIEDFIQDLGGLPDSVSPKSDNFEYDPDYNSDPPFEEEEQIQFVSTYQQMQHTSNISGNLQQFGIFIKEEDEVVQFLNDATKLFQTLNVEFNPSESETLMRFINKFPHPRFINPILAYIITSIFHASGDIYKWDKNMVEYYNKNKEKNLPKIRTIEDDEDDEEQTHKLIEQHDILRYINLFNIYK